MLEDSTMRLSAIGLILALAIFVAPLATEAQQQGKVFRVGALTPALTTSEPYPPLEAFRQGLRDLGYVEGQNLVLEYRYAEGFEQLPALAAELVRLQVEVIVASGVPAIHAAQHATRTIPIVMAGTADPVAAGLVASLAHPGGNTTGLSFLSAELPGKRLEFLKEAVPQSARVAVLINPAAGRYEAIRHNLTGAARALGLQLHVVELRSAEELDTAFVAMTREGADALMVVADQALMDGLRGRIVDLAAKSRLPAMYDWKMYVDAGGLMSYGPVLSDIFQRAATYVDKILKGAKPADLPVEQPTKVELVLNLKTAQALGLTIPPTVLVLADEVIR
jgi:putative tryptophan/tyrosine transport system substrate-binding protein